jgi:predicted O-linked N-acetylglucosamine transferase (SPINDLY family)
MTSRPSGDVSQILDRAIALHQRGQLADAEKLYRNVLRARPNHVEARHFFGILRFQQGRADEALALIAAALDAKPDYPEAHFNRGNVLAALGQYDDALASYDAAIALQPGAAEAHHNRGNALFKLRRYQEALVAFERALTIEPAHIAALNGRGTVLKELRRFNEALASYDRALALRADNAETHYNRGNLFKEVEHYEESLASYAKAQALARDHIDRFGIIDPALAICDWAQSDALTDALRADLAAGRPSVMPFTLVGYCDDAALHLACARNFIADRIPARPTPLWDGVQYRHERIRIAYLSADFRSHATAFLMAELFERHDRGRFEVLGVSFGSDDNSAMRSRLVKSFETFHDVQAQGDREVAALLRNAEVDIAVDLKGYTQGCRPEILAYRPAPIQVGYLGYPGTIGADFLDYVLADPVVLPFDRQAFYTEKIVQLPDCYQVNDSTRVIAAETPSRATAGLPDDGFVFCCFNKSYKIRRPIFDVWMRLLAAVPGSVLWLLQDNDGAERNLRREAAAHGIDPARLVFAGRASLEDHLARHRLADLFLDTLPYNAHTTASDALWAGLPIVTCLGQAFAGRVAASLLNAIGLPELVTHNLTDYEALALRLATDPAAVRAVRAKLEANRPTQPLFDTDRFRRNIEAAYLRMWETWQRGEAVQAFRIEPAG